jgi:filamentous hemagglutinin family protein
MSPWETKRRLMRAHPVAEWIIAVTGVFCCTVTTAEVTLDGSLGPGGALSGPDYAVTADLGRQIESNLFHSFGRFNIDTGESATFSGPSSIDNILGRVTGGSASTIDGLLRSTIPDANLFLMNPAGVVFGPNASLDVPGAFHATTADFIRLADGTRFEAIQSSADALLSTAPPEAFGFLGGGGARVPASH